MIESICRITLVTGVIIVWLAMLFLPTLARANDGRERPKPPVVTQPTPYEGNATHHVIGYGVVSGVMTHYLKESRYAALKAFGATVTIAAIQERSDGHFSSRNFRYDLLGAVLGTVGVICFDAYFKKMSCLP